MSTDDVTVLDLAALGSDERRTAVQAQFDALAPDDGFVFHAAHDPQPVLAHFQETYPDGFDWWPLERGTGRWRIQVAKTAAETEAPRTVTNLMCADHQRLDRLYGRLYKALETQDLDTSRALLLEFEVGLLRHIAAEEDILMPLMAERCGHRGVKDAAQMHEEHGRIQEAFKNAKTALADATADAFKDATAALTEMRFILEGHNQNEERMLYPVSDLETSANERQDILTRIQAL